MPTSRAPLILLYRAYGRGIRMCRLVGQGGRDDRLVYGGVDIDVDEHVSGGRVIEGSTCECGGGNIPSIFATIPAGKPSQIRVWAHRTVPPARTSCGLWLWRCRYLLSARLFRFLCKVFVYPQSLSHRLSLLFGYFDCLSFQGGWALVGEQIAYAAGAARSILMDRQLDPEGMKDDDR